MVIRIAPVILHPNRQLPPTGKDNVISLHLVTRLLAALFLLVSPIFVQLAIADDLIVSRAVLEDKAGTLTIADVAGRQFTAVGPTFSKGFTKSVYWLRLQVRPPANNSEVVLLIRQPFLNEIRLHEAGSGNPVQWKTRVTGNHYPYNERDRASNSLGFVVNVAGAEATYYLRLKTSTASQMSVEALTPLEAERRDSEFDLLEVFFVTAMLLLLLWAIHSYLLDRLPVVGLFAVHQAMYTLFGIAITGYLAPYLPAGYPRLADLSTAIPYCAVNFTTLLFCRELFKSYQPPPLLARGLDLLLLAFPLQLVAIALGYTPLAVISNALLIRISWWYFVLMTFTLRTEQSPSRRMLQIFFLAITLVFTLFWVASSNPAVINNGLIGRQILIVNGIMIGGIFAMILNARSRRLLQEAQQSALELKAKSEFLALVSHEIRTPLNALVGFSSLARTATDPLKIDQYHTILEQSSRSLMELVNDILDMSKIEAGRMDIECVPCNLRQLLAGLEEQYRHLAGQKMLAFQIDVADTVPDWVQGDPIRLRQILANLLANAVKFTEHGCISCTVSTAEDKDTQQLRFEVRDTGIGIPDNKRPLLFQPFRQLDPTITRIFGGSGLGLAIVHNLVGMMRGSISVDSREGAGSCFTVEVPLPATEAPVTQLQPSLAIAIGTVLVVEDNEFNRRLLGDILTAWGQQVILAEDGSQALLFIDQQRFDLVLLDIRMPDIDGMEVARQIRQREKMRSDAPVPIIAITADVDTAAREACRAAGINAVLAKPVIPEELARAIAVHCGTMVTMQTREDLLLNPQTCSDLGDNPERARQYREMLQQDIADELQTLLDALECDNRSDLGRAAHTLKGLCGHLADPEPAELASWLQHNAPTAWPEQLRSVIYQLQTICRSGHDKDSMEAMQ